VSISLLIIEKDRLYTNSHEKGVKSIKNKETNMEIERKNPLILSHWTSVFWCRIGGSFEQCNEMFPVFFTILFNKQGVQVPFDQLTLTLNCYVTTTLLFLIMR